MDRSNTSQPNNRGLTSKRSQTRSPLVGSNQSPPQQQISQLLQPPVAPVWLKSLLTIQQGSLIVFASLFGLSVIVYGYTVYTQDAWRTQHGQLRRLQSQERQQGVMNENLKHELAQAAEQPESGLVAPSPDRIVVIPSAQPRPTKSLPTPPVSQPIQKSQLSRGY
jgi:hypothetical protein